jgi:hypothetical protein
MFSLVLDFAFRSQRKKPLASSFILSVFAPLRFYFLCYLMTEGGIANGNSSKTPT